MNCDTYNVVYLIECNIDSCKQRYIGESDRKIRNRLSEHIGYIRTKKLNMATGAHFNSPGHSTSNLTLTIIENVKNCDPNYRKEREKYLIYKFNTFYKSLNRMP